MATHAAAMKLERRGLLPEVAAYPDDRQQPDALTESEIINAVEDRLVYREWSENYGGYDQSRIPRLVPSRAGHG